MWRTSSKPKIQKSNRNFSFSSFKDIENLCAADDDSFSPSDFIHEQHNTLPSPAGNKRLSVFHRVRLANSCARAFAARPPPESISGEPEPSLAPILIPGAEKRIVVYYTSLRVVRSTFEACRTVQSILQGFRVTIDERDVSMDSAFLEELQRIMGGQQRRRTKLTLPRVFIGGRYIGGAEEIRQLHETGELKKFVEGLPPAETGVCEGCGDYRFILCVECSGSHKCYTEKSGFRICTACNENGLIRCPSCYCAPI